MTFYLQRVVLIVLILSITIPISIGYRQNPKDRSDWKDVSGDDRDDPENDSEIEHYLKDLCSETKKSEQCWKIIKPQRNRFTDPYIRDVASVIIELAIEKSDEINDKLKQLHQESNDNLLKEKYLSCSKNYDDAHHNLNTAKKNLNSDDYRGILDYILDVKKELKSCKHQFSKESYDPVHIGDRNRDFGRYVEIVMTAAKRFVKEKDDDRTQKH